MKKRWTTIVVSAALLCCLGANAQESGQPGEKTPARVMMGYVSQVLEIVQTPEYKDPAKRPECRGQLRTLLMELIDMRTISQLVLADKKKGFTEAQFDEFVDTFSRILFLSYVGHLDDYTDQKVEVLGTEELPKSRVRLKTTTSSPSKGTSTPVEYSMIKKGDTWAAYDVRIEGLSFVSNYRTQFREILMGKTPEQLLRQMKEKAEKLENENIQLKVDEKLF